MLISCLLANADMNRKQKKSKYKRSEETSSSAGSTPSYVSSIHTHDYYFIHVHTLLHNFLPVDNTNVPCFVVNTI